MEDDDEFGDLYTDVLRPFASSPSSSSAPQPHQPAPAPAPAPAPPPTSLDLNPNPNPNTARIPCVEPHANSPEPDPHQPTPSATPTIPDAEARNPVDPMDREVKFDIEEEEDDGGGGGGGEPVIPGLSGEAAPPEEGGEGEGEDWDSDSEDDLKIVLNENSHMAMERGGMVDGDGEEEDGDEELVIVAGGDLNQGAEETEWGENAAMAPGDGERKDAAAGELAKVAAPPKVGYSNHGYHPFHSPFKVNVG